MRGINGAQRRRGRRHDERKGDHDDGFWIPERRWIVQTQVKVVFLRQREGWDVLILRGVGRTENSNHVHDCADVRAVVSTAGRGSGADLHQQIARWSRAKSRNHRLTVSVIQNELISVLSKAGDLLRAGLIKALLLKPYIKAARQQGGARLHLLRIGGSLPHGIQIFFQALTVEAGLFKILRGPHEGSRLSTNCTAYRAERASGFWRQKNDRLLGSFWNGDEYTFIVNLLGPSFDARKP